MKKILILIVCSIAILTADVKVEKDTVYYNQSAIIKENIIPAATSTSWLGDPSHKYLGAYIDSIHFTDIKCDRIITHAINALSGHIANGTVPTNGTPYLTLATAGVTYIDGTPNFQKFYASQMMIDSVGILYYVPTDDTIDLIQWGALGVSLTGITVKMDDETDIIGGIGVEGYAILKDSSITCADIGYQTQITTKGTGGSRISHIMIYMSQ